MLRARSLAVGLGRVTVVDSLDFHILPGEFVAIIGASGAGKSTLLSALSGESRPRRGEVSLLEKPIERWHPASRARHLALLPQHSSVAFAFTGLEVVQLGRTTTGGSLESPAEKALAREALERMGVLHLADRPFQAMSGGEQRRVQIARVLAQLEGPGSSTERALLLDEPASGLDVAAQHRCLGEVLAFTRRGGAALVTIHELTLAAQYADRVLVLGAGRPLAFGPPAESMSAQVLSEAFSWPIEVSFENFDVRPRIHSRPDASLREVLPSPPCSGAAVQ